MWFLGHCKMVARVFWLLAGHYYMVAKKLCVIFNVLLFVDCVYYNVVQVNNNVLLTVRQ